jgi:hypothetical protein
LDFAEIEMFGNSDVATDLPGPGAPVENKMAEGLLPGIQIYRRDPLAGLDKRDRNMHGDRGLARSALFIGDNDDAAGHRFSIVPASIVPTFDLLLAEARLQTYPIQP